MAELFNRIEISGLFGDQNEIIEFDSEENNIPVKVLYGLNGSGKTTIFRIIKSLIEWDPVSLMRLPFSSVKITREEEIGLPTMINRDGILTPEEGENDPIIYQCTLCNKYSLESSPHYRLLCENLPSRRCNFIEVFDFPEFV